MSNTVTDSVRIVLFDRADRARFLVLCEADDPDNWKLPGGKFDTEDETPDAAAARELGEELGVAGLDDLRMVSELTNDDGVSRRYIYSAVVAPDDVHPSDEIAAIKWVTLSTIPKGKNAGHVASAAQAALDI